MYFTRLYNNNIVLVAAMLIIFSTGCDNDLLNTVPKDRLSSETFWNSQEDAELAVNHLYNSLPGTYTLIWDGLSDIATPNNIWHNEVTYVRGQQNGESQVSINHWNNSYSSIRAANNVLENAELMLSDSGIQINEDLMNRYMAEARTIRALVYLQLVSVFGDVPLITSPITIEEGKEVTRTDAQQIWDFIATELEESAQHLETSYTGNNIGRITKGAALALKSRAMLYAGRYTEAHEAAEEVINLQEYSLYPSYENLFSYEAENNEEVILDRQYIRNDQQNNLFALLGNPAMGIGESGAPVPTKTIVDAYEMNNGAPIDEPGSGYDPNNPYEDRDPRLRYSVYVLGDELPNGNTYDPRPGFDGNNDITRGQNTTNTGFNIKKYVAGEDMGTPHNGGLNIILIRYAEVLLTYAEAKIEDNEIDQSVYDAINEVRQRPDVDMSQIINNGQSQSEMREIVRQERMVELAFEGQRFFDIRRWGIAEDVLNEDGGNIYGISYEDPDNPGELIIYRFTEFRRSFDSHHYLWPIPRDEIDLNDNLSQNPGF